jgi:hypothetical protein
MGLNYFYNDDTQSNNKSCINIPNRTIYFGNIPENNDNNDEKYLFRKTSRKYSCESNISNISDIFQKSLSNHSKIKSKCECQKNNSTISIYNNINIKFII